MNKRLERIKAEEEAYRKKRKGNNRKALMSVLLCVFIVIIGAGAMGMQGNSAPPTEPADLPPEDTLAVDGGVDWRLLVVSPAKILERSFTVSLYEVEGKKVDVRIARSLLELLAAARDAGVELTLCSTYRSVSTQRGLYERKVAAYGRQGYDEEKCLELAGRYVQPPGASEHHTGLAVDFFNGDDATLTEAFAKTPAYDWLRANAADYGFIERYGAEKEELTGIGWEPWHYRYVGKAHAEKIETAALCLEEYVAQL